MPYQPAMPKRPDDYMALRRDEILEAVDQCCRNIGWTRTTVRDVAAAAGVSKGGLYVHFPTKADLLEALLRRNLTHLDSMRSLSSPAELIDNVQQQVAQLIGPMGRAGAISRYECQLDGLRSAELKPLVEASVSDAVTVLTELVGSFCPKLSPEEASDRALSIMFFLEGLSASLALSPEFSSQQLQRLVARQLTIFLSCESVEQN